MTYSKWFLVCLVSLLFLSFVNNSESFKARLDYSINGEGDFSKNEKQKIETWLAGVSDAVAQTLGRYQFKVRYNLYKKESSREPVPWANTVRSNDQGVNFHVDPSFSLNEFQMDWTAPHEIAHLSIPFVGRENMWFSEGYASFLQWQVLRVQGLYSSEEIAQKYQSKIEMVKREYSCERSFLAQSEKVKRSHNYPALYWGGACYFISVDEVLKSKHNTNLLEVIKKYQSDGRLEDENLEEVISSLDRISKSTVFSSHFKMYSSKSGNEVIKTIDYMPY